MNEPTILGKRLNLSGSAEQMLRSLERKWRHRITEKRLLWLRNLIGEASHARREAIQTTRRLNGWD
jgi:hypothetical protein